MIPFEIVALLGAVAGFSMILGGMWLVAKGIITLQATPAADALTIEWKKRFRINTQVPGLAFFLVGLIFISTSLWFLRPPAVVPIEFEGQIKGVGVDSPVSILVRPTNWEIPSATTGEISGKVYPDLTYLVIYVNAPGYEPYTHQIKVNAEGSHVAQLGTVELHRSKVQETELKGTIAEPPFKRSEVKVTGFGAPK